MKKQFLYDSNNLPLILVTEATCEACNDRIANVVCAPRSYSYEPLDDDKNLVPIVKFCPCGAITANKNILQKLLVTDCKI